MKPKQLLFTIALFLSFAFVKAQDKYQFMTILCKSHDLYISIDGSKYKTEKIDYANQEKEHENANPFLLKVKEYQEKGWEVMNLNTFYRGEIIWEVYIGYLRKKIK